MAWEYVHPDDREDVLNWLERLGAGETTEPVEYRARHADGSWRWMEAHGNNQLDNPAVEGYVINSRDITARKERQRELEELTSQYQALVENFPSGGVFLFDEDLRYVRAGGEDLSEAGLSSAEVEGNTSHDLYPDEIADEHARHFEQALAGERRAFRQEYRGLQYEIRTVPIRDDTGAVIYGMAVSRNITQLAEQKRELERQNERLEEFASVVSHDLRNPLQTAGGWLELAKADCDSTHLDDIGDAHERMDALIEDLLALAQGGETVGSTEAVSLSSLIEKCWEVVPSENATLNVETDRTISADRSRLQQLLENLFSNAVEHGGEDVTVRVDDLTEGFYIADDGVGIPEGEREDIFGAGYSTAEEGTGFGLRIAKQVVEAHGWDIRVIDSDDDGAQFEITGVDTPE
jgi:PAS domain S-box-containing protein